MQGHENKNVPSEIVYSVLDNIVIETFIFFTVHKSLQLTARK